MEAHVGDKIIVRSTHQGEPERTGEVVFYPAGTCTVVHAESEG
jgi:hypothetical protein